MNILNKKIIYILYELKINPSVFIKTYKASGSDIKKSVSSFLKYNCHLEKLPASEGKKEEYGYRLLLDFLDSNEIEVANISEASYPELLKKIYFPPPLLFMKGKREINSGPCMAIVGTRKSSKYGRDVAVYISEQLSKIGITVVSGMAHGIDYYAQKTAIMHTGGSIGVLGCGIDIIYPPENKDLFEEIIQNGQLITEYFPGTPPLKQNFPSRNRIISGTSMGVLVIEAGEKSGALITADFALEQNREVFCTPGSIFSNESKGTHKLIKNGAKLVDGIDDILIEINNFLDLYKLNKEYLKSLTTSAIKTQDGMILNKKDGLTASLSKEQKQIYEIIGFKGVTIEEMLSIQPLTISRLLQVLSELKVMDLIKEKNLNEFIRL